MNNNPPTFLDASGLACPLPVIKAKKILNQLQVNDMLEVLTTDPGAAADFKSFCHMCGHRLISCEEQNGTCRVKIQKG